MTVKQYRDRLNKHDWFYMMSEDRRVYDNGKANELELKQLAATKPSFQKAFDAKYKTIISNSMPNTRLLAPKK